MSTICTHATLGSAGISCRHSSCVCLSVRLSQVGVLLKRLNVGSRKQRHTIARPRTVGFCSLPKFRQNSNRVTPNGGAKCRWGYRLNADEVAENWRLSTRSVINLVRSQVYHTERPLSSFAARSPWCSASRGFVSNSWSLLNFELPITTDTNRAITFESLFHVSSVLLLSLLLHFAKWPRPSVCLSVPRRIRTVLHGSGCNLEEW